VRLRDDFALIHRNFAGSFQEPEPDQKEPEGSEDVECATEIQRLVAEQVASQLDESFRKGYEEGKAAGLREGAEQLRPVIQNLNGVVEKITSERERLWREMEMFAVTLASGIAGSIIKKEVEKDDGIVKEVVRAAIEQAMGSDIIALRVNPADAAVLNGTEMDSKIGAFPSIEVKSDPHVSRGGCIVETNMGIFDASLETQIEEIRERLLEQARKER
jgi:flagellar assembly protein FliH